MGRLRSSHWLTIAGLVAFPGVMQLAPGPISHAQLQQIHASVDREIGSLDDPATSFGRVVDLAPHGQNIVVLDALSASLREFSPDGALVRTMGRKGEGPGEFMGPARVGVLPSGFWVWDALQNRISQFTTSGVHRATRRLPMPPRGRLEIHGALSDSVYAGTILEPALLGGTSPNRVILAVRTQSLTLDTLTSISQEQAFFTIPLPGLPGGGLAGPQPLGHVAQWASSAAEGALYTADHRSGPPDTLVVSRIALDGEVRWTFRTPFTPVPVSNERYDAEIRRIVSMFDRLRAQGAPTPGDPDGAARAAIRRPRSLPSATGLVVGGADVLLLRREPSPPNQGQRWTLVEDGKPTRDIMVPPNIKVMAMRGEYLWGVRKGDFDVETVVRLRLRR